MDFRFSILDFGLEVHHCADLENFSHSGLLCNSFFTIAASRIQDQASSIEYPVSVFSIKELRAGTTV
ncbi:MAG: hypothetical protein PVH02_16350 [Desulfobacteraceae bacterium]